MRPEPEKVLPPLLVMALMTPPENRPVLGRDAGGQDLRLLDRVLDEQVLGVANRLSLTSTPLIMNTLSNANAPLITSWLAFGDASLRRATSVAMPWSVRDVASASTSSCLMLAPTTGVAIGAGVSASDLNGFNHRRRLHRDVSATSSRAALRSYAYRREAAQLEFDLVVAGRKVF